MIKMLNESRCKDISPYETVEKIRGILHDMNIIIFEEWKEPVRDIFSVYLRIDCTCIFVNGKGSSRIYALASGYGEMMERLQNLVYFRFSPYYKNKMKNANLLYEHGDFFSKEILEFATQRKWWDQNRLNDSKKVQLINLWTEKYSGISTIKNGLYCNINNKEDMISIPYDIVEYYYGSNGMAAGNSINEAMVQACCEALERYIIKKCISQKICVPDITEYACHKYDFVEQIREEYLKYGYQMFIKDLSVVDDIPGISVVICNDKFEYFVATGVHPVEEVAIERTLTEICQGKKLKKWSLMLML